MDFTVSPAVEKLRRRVQEFVAEELLPAERDPTNWGDGENIRLDRLDGLREKAKKAGLWAPQMPKERGGLGLNHVGMAVIYEEAARSLFGPVAINCAAPDDG